MVSGKRCPASFSRSQAPAWERPSSKLRFANGQRPGNESKHGPEVSGQFRWRPVVHNSLPFASYCSKIFSSVPPTRHREIGCQSLIEFVRLRPFLVFHRVLAIVCPVFRRVRVCSSLSQFDRLRSSSNPIITPRRAEKRKLSDSSCFFYLLLSQNHTLPFRPALGLFVLFCSAKNRPLRNSVSKFDRLRPFLVFHKVLTIVFPLFRGVRVCSSLSQFDRLRPGSTPNIPTK